MCQSLFSVFWWTRIKEQREYRKDPAEIDSPSGVAPASCNVTQFWPIITSQQQHHRSIKRPSDTQPPNLTSGTTSIYPECEMFVYSIRICCFPSFSLSVCCFSVQESNLFQVCTCHFVSWTLRTSTFLGLENSIAAIPTSVCPLCLGPADSFLAGCSFRILSPSAFKFLLCVQDPSFTLQGLLFWLPHISVIFCPVIY